MFNTGSQINIVNSVQPILLNLLYRLRYVAVCHAQLKSLGITCNCTKPLNLMQLEQNNGMNKLNELHIDYSTG